MYTKVRQNNINMQQNDTKTCTKCNLSTTKKKFEDIIKKASKEVKKDDRKLVSEKK